MNESDKIDKIAIIKDGMIFPNLFKVSEVAAAIGISKNTLYREINAGRLRARRPLGRKTGYRLSLDDVNDWIARTTEVIGTR